MKPVFYRLQVHSPSKKYLKGKAVEELREEFVPISHNKCSTKTCEKILNVVSNDKVKENDHQDASNIITVGIVSDLEYSNVQLEKVDVEIK